MHSTNAPARKELRNVTESHGRRRRQSPNRTRICRGVLLEAARLVELAIDVEHHVDGYAEGCARRSASDQLGASRCLANEQVRLDVVGGLPAAGNAALRTHWQLHTSVVPESGFDGRNASPNCRVVSS
jgi:hypothetical protein